MEGIQDTESRIQQENSRGRQAPRFLVYIRNSFNYILFSRFINDDPGGNSFSPEFCLLTPFVIPKEKDNRYYRAPPP